MSQLVNQCVQQAAEMQIKTRLSGNSKPLIMNEKEYSVDVQLHLSNTQAKTLKCKSKNANWQVRIANE